MVGELVEYAGKPEWLDARRKVVTATDVGRIVGVSKWGGPLEVFGEKMGMQQDENERMLIGRELQTGIASAYHQLRTKLTGEACDIKHVSPFALQWGPRPRHAASLDCMQRLGDAPDWHPLEIKSTAAYVVEPYDEWLTQVQWQMYVTETRRATIAALRAGDDIEWWDIERDDSVIQPLVEAADAFLAQNLDRAEPPPPGAHDWKGVKRLYPDAGLGVEITFGIEELDLATHHLAVKEEIAGLYMRKEQLEAQLMAKMGLAEIAYLPNGTRITWKNQARKSYVVPPTNARVFKIEKAPR